MRQPSCSADLGGLQNIDSKFSSNALKFAHALGAVVVSFPDEMENVIHRTCAGKCWTPGSRNSWWVPSMKRLINTSFWDKDYGSLWQTFLTKMPHRQDFQNVLHLVEILLVLPISAAQCERAISAENRIKSSMWVNLGSSTLEDLIRGPDSVVHTE